MSRPGDSWADDGLVRVGRRPRMAGRLRRGRTRAVPMIEATKMRSQMVWPAARLAEAARM